MQRARFVFVQTVAAAATGDRAAERMLWMLVSSNNRRLGQDVARRATYADSRAAVRTLQLQQDRLAAQTTADQRDGGWVWQLSLDGTAVASSSRAYLRTRECDYNLQRFLDALAVADVMPGARRTAAGRTRMDHGSQVSARRVFGADRGAR